MTALRRVADAGGWALGLWLVFFVLAKAARVVVATSAEAAMGPYAGPPPGREDLFAVAQLLYLDQGLAAALSTAPVLMAIVGFAVWTAASGLVIARLEGTTGRDELGKIALGSLRGVVAQSVWHGIFRAILLVVVAVSLGPLSPIAMLITLAVAWLLASLALDLARVGVVLHGARPLHPATAAYAFVRAATRPRLLGLTAVLTMAQLACAATVAHVALGSIGAGSSSIASALLSAIGIAFGLLRLSIVIGHGTVPLRSMSSDDETNAG